MGEVERSAVIRGQKRGLELAMQDAPLGEILDVLVRAIEEHCGQEMIASIQVVEGGRLRHGAAPHLPDTYNAQVDGLPIGPNQGSCGTAAHFGEVVAVANIALDPRWAAYRDIAERHGLAACWSSPIRSPDNAIVGTFAHYYRTPRDPTPHDLEAIAWIADTAGLVIDRELRGRRQRDAEAALSDALDKLTRQVAGMHLVHELAIGLHAPTELEPVLELVLDVATRIHAARQGILFVYDDAGETLHASAMLGFDGVAEPLIAELTRDVQRRDGQRYVIEDTTLDTEHRHLHDIWRQAGIRAVHRTPIRTRSGRPLGVLVVHLAESRRPSELEEQLTDLCARHAADAIERAHSMSEIRRAKDQAEQANRAKDEFLAILGHELRNPLSPIAHAVDLLDVQSADTRTRAAREVIERQLRHLTRLVDDLLDVSRIRSGRLELDRTHVGVDEVIARAVEMTAGMFAARNHRVETHVEPDLRVDGDATRLAQIVSNLLANAAKYSDANRTTVVTARRTGSTIQIAVADQGMGIAPSMLPRVFELFTQEERALGRAQGGLGLGLAIVRKLVVLHGGTVRVESEGVGRGSTFTVTLPAVDAARVKEAPVRTSTLRRPRARRVLVVDDNVDVAQMMAELLAEMGHDVRIANDGHAALATFGEFDAEVVFLDIGMPEMNGFEVAQAVRERVAMRPFLVAVTGYAHASDRERAKGAGFDAHLIKPVSLESVLRLIDEVPVRQSPRA